MNKDIREGLAAVLYAFLGALGGLALLATDNGLGEGVGKLVLFVAAIAAVAGILDIARGLREPNQSADESSPEE